MITHVKGHVEAGLGGAIKNIGMGGASRVGKQLQHGETFSLNPGRSYALVAGDA